MKSLFRIMTVTMVVAGLGALVACSATAGAKGGDRSLVNPDQPHAILSTAWSAGPNYYPVKIVWLDGNYLSTTRRRNTFWVAPGTHKIGFRAIIDVSRGPSTLVGSSANGSQDMPTLTLNLKQGYTYYFAAKIPKTGMPNQWKPVVIRTVKPGGK